MSDLVKLGTRPDVDTGVTTGDMSRYTGMSQRFFQEEIQAGEIPAAKFGRTYRIPDREAIRYLKQKGWPIPARFKK